MKKKNFLSQNLFAEQSQKMLKIGMYAFTNHRFSEDPQAYDELLGIVAWVNDNPQASQGLQGLIVTCEEKLLNALQAKCYCENYTLHGVREGRGFLPNQECWEHILENVKSINRSLMRIAQKPLQKSYWTATERDEFYGMSMPISSSKSHIRRKDRCYLVRCVLPF